MIQEIGLTTTDVLAVIGAVTGIIGTIAGLGALGWDYYKWRYSERVQLKVIATPGMSTTFSNETLIRINVVNIGKISTTIKMLSFHGFNSKADMKKRNGKNLRIVITTLYSELPAKLNPGDDWDGYITQYQEGFEDYLKFKHFIVQIEDTMSEFPFRAEIDKSRIKELPIK